MKLRSAEVLLSFCQGCGALRLRDVKDKLQQLFTDEETILPDVCAICGKNTSPHQNNDGGKESLRTRSTRQRKTSPELSHESIETARVSMRRNNRETQNKTSLEETEDVSQVDQCSKMKSDDVSVKSVNSALKEDNSSIHQDDKVDGGFVNNSSINSSILDGEVDDVADNISDDSALFHEGAEVDSDSAEEDGEGEGQEGREEGREDDEKEVGPSGFDMTGTIKTDVDWKGANSYQKSEMRKQPVTVVPRRTTRLSTGTITAREYNVKGNKDDADDDNWLPPDEDDVVDKDDDIDRYYEDDKMQIHVVKNEQQEQSTVKKPNQGPRTTEGIDPEILTFTAHNDDPMRPFKCKLCTKACCFSFVSNFQLHLQTHHGKEAIAKPYKCEVCGRNFRVSFQMNAHKKRVHSDRSQAFRCTVRRCKYSYSTRYDLKRHMEVHRGNKSHKCKTCGLGFTKKRNLEIHQTTHSEDRLLIPCKDCGKTFSHAQRLLVHSYIHLNADRFKCDQCNYTCRDRHRLMKHKQTHERGDGNPPKQPAEKSSGDKDIDITSITKWLDPKILDMMGKPRSSSSPFKCKHCTAAREFKHIYSFLKHTRLMHPEENVVDKPYKCDICHNHFKTHHKLALHLPTHSDIKSFACPECDKKFKNTVHLNAHKKIHEPREKMCNVCGACFMSNCKLKAHIDGTHLGIRAFKCDQCDKSFSDMAKRRIHVQRVHGDGSRPWMCDLCGKSFKVKVSLQAHTYRAHRGKMFACEVCDYRCIRPDYLRKHLRTHTGEKPYHCEASACQESFSNRTSLVLHQKKHHQGGIVVKPSVTSSLSQSVSKSSPGVSETLHPNQTDERSVAAPSLQSVKTMKVEGLVSGTSSSEDLASGTSSSARMSVNVKTMKVEGLVSGTSSSEHLASGTSSSAQSVNDMTMKVEGLVSGTLII